MGISVCAFSSLMLSLWFGGQTAYGMLEGTTVPPVLRFLHIAGALVYFLCFFGLRKYRLWAWILFLLLTLRLLFYNLFSAYVFFFRLSRENLATVQYEVAVGAALGIVLLILASFIWLLTKPNLRIQFRMADKTQVLSRSTEKNHLLCLAGVSVGAMLIFCLENALTLTASWRLASTLLGAGLAIFWVSSLAHSQKPNPETDELQSRHS